MGDKNVQMPDGSVVAFPDSMSDDQIAAVLKAQHPAAQTPPQQGFLGSFEDSSGLSMIGHALAHPIDTAGTVLDAAKRVVATNQPADMSANPNPIISGIGSAIDNTKAKFKQGVADYKANGLSLQTRRDFANAIPILGPALETAEQQSDAGNNTGAMGTMMGLGAAAIAPKIIKEAPAAVVDAAKKVIPAAARVVAGSALDTPIRGDSVTPRELYNTAKDMGVNLDAAQATGSALTTAAKKVTEHSLAGASKFADNNASNLQALHVQAEKILDAASPNAMDRQTFGKAVQQQLLAHQQELSDDAGAIYKQLDQDVGATNPDASGIRGVAQSIVAQNKAYFQAHPEILSGGDKKAWGIVNDLATSADLKPPATVTSPIVDESGKPFISQVPAPQPYQDSWSDLHKLRSDLLDITRGKELVGTRATGWIKQLTGAVDGAMTDPGGMDSQSAQSFRTANNIYSLMKSTYDDPLSKLYHVVRAPDGLTAANTLANITPQVAQQIGHAAPDLIPQLQRQTLSRILSPAGNEVPDLQNLSSRLSRVPKEQLNGVLSPGQMQDITDLARVSKVVHGDINPSGTAKVLQATSEIGSHGGALLAAFEGMHSGGVVGAAAAGMAAETAATAGKGLVAKTLTSPAFTEAVMKASRGPEGWALRGQAKVMDYMSRDASSGLTSADLDTLRSTPAGKKILIDASGRSSGSAAMKRLVAQLAAMKGEQTSSN